MTSNLSIFFVSFFCQFFFSFVAEDRNLSATVCRPQLRWTSGDRIQNCANVLRDERVFLELGTRQHCHDNVTLFSGQKVVDYCIVSLFAAATLFRHLGLDIVRIFSCL